MKELNDAMNAFAKRMDIMVAVSGAMSKYAKENNIHPFKLTDNDWNKVCLQHGCTFEQYREFEKEMRQVWNTSSEKR